MAITAESLLELIKDVRGARADVAGKIPAAEKALADLREEDQGLAVEEQNYRATLTRRYPDRLVDADIVPDIPYSPDATRPQVTSSATAAAEWLYLPRTLAVERVVSYFTDVKGFATPGDIERFLGQQGRTDSRDEVGGALAHLKRTEKIHSTGRAQWATGVGTETAGQDVDQLAIDSEGTTNA